MSDEQRESCFLLVESFSIIEMHSFVFSFCLFPGFVGAPRGQNMSGNIYIKFCQSFRRFCLGFYIFELVYEGVGCFLLLRCDGSCNGGTLIFISWHFLQKQKEDMDMDQTPFFASLGSFCTCNVSNNVL